MKDPVYLSSSHISKRVSILAKAISKYYKGKDIIVIGVLNGSFIFMADLVRQIKAPLQCDFIRVRSYSKNVSTGVLKILSQPKLNLKGKHILLVEDIVDTEFTLKKLVQHFNNKKVLSLNICTLLCKSRTSFVKKHIRFVGFDVPNYYFYGYGLDDCENFRHFPDIMKKQSP